MYNFFFPWINISMFLKVLRKVVPIRVSLDTCYFASSSVSSSRPSAAKSRPIAFRFSSSAFLLIKSLFFNTSVCRFIVFVKYSLDAFISLAKIFRSSSGSIWNSIKKLDMYLLRDAHLISFSQKIKSLKSVDGFCKGNSRATNRDSVLRCYKVQRTKLVLK